MLVGCNQTMDPNESGSRQLVVAVHRAGLCVRMCVLVRFLRAVIAVAQEFAEACRAEFGGSTGGAQCASLSWERSWEVVKKYHYVFVISPEVVVGMLLVATHRSICW